MVVVVVVVLVFLLLLLLIGSGKWDDEMEEFDVVRVRGG